MGQAVYLPWGVMALSSLQKIVPGRQNAVSCWPHFCCSQCLQRLTYMLVDAFKVSQSTNNTLYTTGINSIKYKGLTCANCVLKLNMKLMQMT